MHRIERTAEGWRVTLDGPMSLFRLSSRYGLQLAIVLADILHLDAWSLEADVLWTDRTTRATFQLDASEGLVSHTKPKGTWTSSEEKRVFGMATTALSPGRLATAARSCLFRPRSRRRRPRRSSRVASSFAELAVLRPC